METINKKQWSKYKMLVFEGQHMAYGILTLWNPQSMNLLAVEATRHTLSANMQIIGNTEVILCTNVYGPQMLEEKRRMLLDLENLKARFNNLQWILAGDFNIIMTLAEKKWGTRRMDRDEEELSAFIDTMDMVDIRTSNGQFTWNKKRINNHQVATRLDRFLVSESIILQGLTLDCNIPPWGGQTIGQFNWKQTSKPLRRTNLLDLRNFGSNTPPSRRTSTNGGGRNYRRKGQGCSKLIRTSSTSNISSRSGTRKSLET
jgi:hypothetical protein